MYHSKFNVELEAQAELEKYRFRRLIRQIVHPWQKLNLCSFNDKYDSQQTRHRIDKGICLVPVDKIVGSVSDNRNFDDHFNPRDSVMDERWTNLYIGFLQGNAIPPIDVYQIGEYTYYNCDVWENFETDNEAAPDSSSSWQPLDLDCCEPIYTGSGIVDIPCALMVSGTGNCQIIYTFQGSPDDPANPFYEACDPNWDLSFSQLYYYTGVWQTYGPYCNIPDSDLYIKESGCSPTGTYDHPSGHQVKVRICTWCSGCDCPPSGSLNQQSDCYGGDCFGKTDGPETWLTYSGCLDDPLAPRP